MGRYKIKFNEEELNKFILIESKKVRKSAMSLYSYFRKLSTDGKLIISQRKFLARYIRYHQVISRKTFQNRIELLEELGLIIVDRTDANHVYFIASEVSEKVATQKEPETIENTELIEDSILPNNQLQDNIDIDIYTNTSSPKNNTFKGDTLKCVKEAEEIAKEVLKELKIKSSWIRLSTIAVIKERFSTIHLRGARQYIRTTILKLQAISKAIYRKTNAYIDRKSVV